MSGPFRLIVTDTSPLITLALADALDALLRPGMTEIGIDQKRRLEEGRSICGLGEQAAPEVPERFLRSDPAWGTLLLFEDSGLERRRAILDERVALISTGDFLRELEVAKLIQSADHVLDEAAMRGRNGERQRRAAEDAMPRERLREQLARPDRPVAGP